MDMADDGKRLWQYGHIEQKGFLMKQKESLWP
jgi:hypothetical protein